LHIIRPFLAGSAEAEAKGDVAEPATWLIKRNCSASPRLLAGVFASLVAVSFAFGATFAAEGLWMVLPFVGLEIVAVAAAFLCYGRHAADFERIELNDGVLTVERQEGGRSLEFKFDAPWVRVELEERGAGLGKRVRLALACKGQRIEIGRYLVDDRRSTLGREIRGALGAPARRGASVVQ
jgi:uncharacterized membrane protein